MFAARSLISKGRFLPRRPISSLPGPSFSSYSSIFRSDLVCSSPRDPTKDTISQCRMRSIHQVRSYTPSSALFEAEQSSSGPGESGYQVGFVKWFDTTRGYGFIVCDALDRDIFVHQTDIMRQGFRFLDEGDEVKFYIETDQNGKMKAKEVTDKDGNELTEANPSRGY